MGLLYWNIINTLLTKKQLPTLYFSVQVKKIKKNKNVLKYCELYAIPLNYFIETFKTDKIIFKNDNHDYLNNFKIVYNRITKVIKISSLPHTTKIIKYLDNKDKPFKNNINMCHSPFIISDNKMYKLPEDDILIFNKQNGLILLKEKYKHAGYSGITIYHKEIRTIKDEYFNSTTLLKFNEDYETYLNNILDTVSITLKSEYEFSLKYV